MTGGLVYLAHAEVFLVYLAAVAGIVVGRSIVVAGRRRRLGLGLAPGTRRRIGLASAIVGVAVVGGTLANGALTGSFRIVGYVTAERTETAGGVATQGFIPEEVPPGWTLSGDPTWDFYVAAVAPAAVGQPAPHRFLDPRMLPRSILVVWSGLDARERAGLVTLLALLALPIVSWPFLDPRRRRAVVTWAVFGAAIFAGSYLLFAISHTYVPQRTGPRRIMPYELLVAVGAGTFLLWGLDRLAVRGWRALLPYRGAMLAAGTALAIACTGMVSAGPVAALDDPEPGLTGVGYEAYTWIDGNVPSDARILTNAYTDGALTALSHRVGIVDGRAVYLENPQFLHDSTALALGARVVFGDPAGSGARSFLDRQHVDYLLVVGPTGSGNDIGGYLPFETDNVALGASPRYTLVRTFGDGRLSLYRVEPGS